MNLSLRYIVLAALVAPLLFAAAPLRAVDITITNTGAAPGVQPCVLHMSTAPGGVLQTNPNGVPGDLMVAGTFSAGDACIAGAQRPAPTGTISLPPATVPTANQAFPVNWTAQNATKCEFSGNGWSGDACGGAQPPCSTTGASGTKSVTLPEGSYNFGLSCKNDVGPLIQVANKVINVVPAAPSTCGYGVGSATRQMAGIIGFHGSTVKFQNQPLTDWGAMFGITRSCTAAGDTCPPPWPTFPQITNNPVFFTAQTSQYLSLALTTADLDLLHTNGAVRNTQDPGATPGTDIRFSISDRCGDFDAVNSPWLHDHPMCIQTLGQKAGFGWTSVPSNFTCSFRRNGILDPNQVWYLNMKVTRCNGQTGGNMPAQCKLYLLNGG